MKKSLQILLIDDDDEHSLFEQVLNEIDEHIDFYHAMNGEDAVRLLGSSTDLPDYIFLDLNMPRMDGKQCLSELKDLCNVPVIIYTTSSSPKDINDTKHLGAKWFLVKPSSLKEIKKAIELILNDRNGPNHFFPVSSGIYKF